MATNTTTAATVLITGNTYPVKDSLKALGGRWDAAAKGWRVPAAVADKARTLVSGTTPARQEPRRDPATPRGPCMVGVAGAYQAEYVASRSDRTPGRDLGSVSWLRHQGSRIPVVLVGYEPATYIRGEDAEDMGHYGVSNGYYGTLHLRNATAEEAAPLRAQAQRAGIAQLALAFEWLGNAIEEQAAKAILATMHSVEALEQGALDGATSEVIWSSKASGGKTAISRWTLSDGTVCYTRSTSSYDDFRQSLYGSRETCERLAASGAKGQLPTSP